MDGAYAVGTKSRQHSMTLVRLSIRKELWSSAALKFEYVLEPAKVTEKRQ